jgi:tape measure domain-containing protein
MAVDIETIGFGADVSGLKNAQRELDNTSKSAVKAADGADRMSGKFSALSSAASMLKGVLAGVGIAALGRQFIEVADAMAMMEARLKLATGNLADFAAAQREVYRISQSSQVGMQEIATLYTRMADPVRRLGGGVRETAAITEAFAQTLRISGASTAEASAATLQFSQAMAAGALRGDEFNSIAETSPRLLKVVAEALGTNAGALREMAADGQLTADVVGNALIGALDELRGEASKLPDTVSGVMTQLSNLTQTLVGEFNQASNATGGMAAILRDTLVPALKVAYTAVAGLYGVLQSVAHVWVGVLSAASMAMQREFKLALTMLKQIPIDIERTATDTAASIARVWAMGLEGSEESTGALKTLKGVLGQTGKEAGKAAKELEKMARQQEALDQLVDKADLDDRLQVARLQNAAFDDEFERIERNRKATEDRIRTGREMLAGIQFETATLGMSNVERETAIAMLQLEREGVVKGTEAYNAYAEAIKGAIIDRETKRAGIAQTKALEQEWAQATARIGQSFSDALMDGGKSAWEYLKGLFRSGLHVPIQAFMTSVMGSAGNAFASMVGGGGSSGVGGAGSALNLMGSLGSLGSFAATGFMNTVAGTGMMGGLSAAGSLMSGGSIAGGLGMGLGAVAPYAMAAIALYSLLSSGGEKRAGSTYGYSAGGLSYGQGLNGIWSDEIAGMIGAGQTRFIGGPSGGDIGGETVRASVAATVAGINGLFERLGSTDKIDQFWGKLEQSEKNRGGVFSGGRLASGASFGETTWESGTSRTLTAEEAIQAFALDLQQATIQALQSATDIPASVQDVLRDVDAESLTQDQVAGLLQTVEAIVQVTQALSMLGVQADSVTTAMLQAAGGAESLQTAAAAYYQGYYSEAERVGRVSEQLADQFAGLGLEMPATRDEFRALVESLDLTSASGQAAYGALLPLSDAFGVVADWSSRAAEEAARAAEEMARATEETARAAEMARLDAQAQATGAEIDALIAQFGDLAGAMRELEPPAETLVDAWRRTASELQSLEQGLAAALGGAQMSSLDQLRATTTSIANIGAALQGLDDQIMSLRTGTGDASALSALRGEESRLASELGSSSDPAAVAGRLAQITVQRIQLEARLQQDALQGRIDGLKEVADLERAARQDQIASLNDQIRAAGRLREIGESLTGLTAELQYGSLSALNPFARQAAASGEYQRILAAALGGDADAAGEFGGMARTYLSASQDMYGGSTGQYASIFAEVLADAQRLGLDLSGADASAETAQLEALQAIEQYQEQAQQAVIDTSAEQIDALTAIREALIGRQDELRAQQAEQAGALREQVAALRQLVEGQEAEIRQRAEAMAQLNARLDTLIAAQEGQARAAELEAASA